MSTLGEETKKVGNNHNGRGYRTSTENERVRAHILKIIKGSYKRFVYVKLHCRHHNSIMDVDLPQMSGVMGKDI